MRTEWFLRAKTERQRQGIRRVSIETLKFVIIYSRGMSREERRGRGGEEEEEEKSINFHIASSEKFLFVLLFEIRLKPMVVNNEGAERQQLMKAFELRAVDFLISK